MIPAWRSLEHEAIFEGSKPLPSIVKYVSCVALTSLMMKTTFAPWRFVQEKHLLNIILQETLPSQDGNQQPFSWMRKKCKSLTKTRRQTTTTQVIDRVALDHYHFSPLWPFHNHSIDSKAESTVLIHNPRYKKTSKEPNMRTSEKNREFSLWLYIRGTVCHAESTELQAFFSWTCESFAPCILQNHLSILLLMTRCLHRYCHLHGDVPKFR